MLETTNKGVKRDSEVSSFDSLQSSLIS